MSSAEATSARKQYAVNAFSARGFVAKQEKRYAAIWASLGWEWNNWFFAAAKAVNAIPGPEHGQLNPQFSITADQHEDVFLQLSDMGWFTGLPLRRGVYDYLLIMGAKYQAMVTRGIMLKERLDKTERQERITFRKMFALSGQRPRGNKIDGTVEEIYGGLTNEVRVHPWVKAQMLLMQNDDAYDEFGGAFATEFELMTLSIIVAYNGTVQVGNDVSCYDESLPDVPPRTVESCTITLPQGVEILVINAPAVERPYGPPRPTSISTTKYLIEKYGLTGGTVVVVTVRVHGRRMLGDSERTIHQIDPSVTVIGYAASISQGDARDFFAQALGETVNQLVKAVEEFLNNLRPAGAKPLDLKQVRMLLDRLNANPTQAVLMGVIAEVMVP
jgi:hypothetical protein